jgi:hypothetical protein
VVHFSFSKAAVPAAKLFLVPAKKCPASLPESSRSIPQLKFMKALGLTQINKKLPPKIFW